MAQRLLVGYLPVIENKLTSDLMAAQNTRENIDPTSGSDQEDGLIWGYHFGPTSQRSQSLRRRRLSF